MYCCKPKPVKSDTIGCNRIESVEPVESVVGFLSSPRCLSFPPPMKLEGRLRRESRLKLLFKNVINRLDPRLRGDDNKLGLSKALFDDRSRMIDDGEIFDIFFAGFSFIQPWDIQNEQNFRIVERRRLMVLWGILFDSRYDLYSETVLILIDPCRGEVSSPGSDNPTPTDNNHPAKCLKSER